MERGRGDNKGKEDTGRERGEGCEGITKLKTNMISAAAERKQYILLSEACLAACSRGWVLHCGMTLPLNVFCLCSHQIQRCSVSTGKRSRENWVDYIGKLVPVDTLVRFYAHIDRRDRGFCTQSVWWQGASAMTAGHEWCVPETLFWLQHVQQHSRSFVGDLTD